MSSPSANGRVLTATVDLPESHTLKVYRKHGGYEALEIALGKSPDEVIDLVKRSGLRGRGGAGFPTGTKWGFVPKATDKPKYLCVNADESEPGAFKDRLLCAKDPHQVIEGTLIGAYAIGARRAYIYIRGEFAHECDVMQAAIDEARAAGLVGKNILGKGFNVKIPQKLIKPVRLPAGIKQSLEIQGMKIALEVKPTGLLVASDRLWYGADITLETAKPPVAP